MSIIVLFAYPDIARVKLPSLIGMSNARNYLYQRVLQIGANEASDQELQQALQNERNFYFGVINDNEFMKEKLRSRGKVGSGLPKREVNCKEFTQKGKL